MHKSHNATLDASFEYPGKSRSFLNRSGHPVLALAATAAVLLGACSSDNTTSTDDSEPPATELGSTDSPTSAPSTSDAVVETDPTTTTSEPVPATEVTTTTEAQLPTTGAPPPTLPAEDDLTAQLNAALAAHAQAWVTCVSQAPACDLNALAGTRAAANLEGSVEIASGVNTNGWSVSNVESYRVQPESVEFSSNEQMAFVTSCIEDGLVVSDMNGVVINDQWSSQRAVRTFEMIDGTWKVTTSTQLEKEIGQENTLCSF